MRELSTNERRIIELIATRGRIARVDLARESGLTGASVTRIIASLADLKLLEEKADKAGAQGQPKRLLSIRPNSYFAVGFTFTLQTLELALVDATGKVMATKTVRTPSGGAVSVADAARETVASVLAGGGIPQERVIGIGCAMAGNFGANGKRLAPHEDLSELDDVEAFKDFVSRLGLPFHMENDGTSAALGEQIFGRQEHDGSSLYLIHLGHGIGGGVIVDGAPFSGANGNAGLPGFLYPYGVPRPSARDLLEHLLVRGHELSDFRDLDSLSPEDPDLAEWCRRAGRQLRDAVRAACAFLDPSVIVVGGRLPVFILERLVTEISSEPISPPSRGLTIPPIRASRLGPAGGAIGAACLPMFRSLFAGAHAGFGSHYLNERTC